MANMKKYYKYDFSEAVIINIAEDKAEVKQFSKNETYIRETTVENAMRIVELDDFILSEIVEGEQNRCQVTKSIRARG